MSFLIKVFFLVLGFYLGWRLLRAWLVKKLLAHQAQGDLRQTPPPPRKQPSHIHDDDVIIDVKATEMRDPANENKQ